MEHSQSIAQRSAASAMWSVFSSLGGVSILFVRSVILARWLPVDVFGIYAFASSVAALTIVAAKFGMRHAFIYRAPEVENEELAARIHFTLNLILTSVWIVLMIAGSLLFTEGQIRTALILLTITSGGVQLALTPQLILTRRVLHRRLALMRLLNILISTGVALSLAWQGVTLWALLASDLVTLVITVVVLYLWRPVWKPRLAWSKSAVKYFVSFGSRNFLAICLRRALDRVDDIWVGLFLGKTALGFYSRAYAFASYPSHILASPINKVSLGTYAELKGDSQKLSKAFFHTNSLLIRSGFFLAGGLVLVAPEFIGLVLGAKWLPMLSTFRLMLIFTLLDPIKITLSNLFLAVGRPDQVTKARTFQLVVLLLGMFLLGPTLGIVGVALAVDLMLLVGISMLLWQAKAYVSFSIKRMFTIPGLALLLAMSGGHYAGKAAGWYASVWHMGVAKIAVFSILYVGTILLLEWDEIRSVLNSVRQLTRLNRSAV